MSAGVLTPRSPPTEFTPSSFNGSYGADVVQLAATPGANNQASLPPPNSLGSVNEHFPLSQEVTQEGDAANYITLSGQYQDSGGMDDGMQFNMDEDNTSDGSDEVKSKTPSLHGVRNPVPVTRQNSTTDTDSTITDNQQLISPIEEENPVVYRQSATIPFYRKMLCQGICQLENAPHLEKTIEIEMNKSAKVKVDLQFMPFCSCPRGSHGKFITLQAYFKMPTGKKSLRLVENIVSGYRQCEVRLVATVRDPQTNAVITETTSKPQPFVQKENSCGAQLVYAEIEQLVHHNSIIYARTKYLEFKITAEIICKCKITSRNATLEGSGEVVLVE